MNLRSLALVVCFLAAAMLSAAPKPDGKVVTNSIGMKLVLIPAGEFLMGGAIEKNARPIHKVKITKDFYLGAFEVTQAQYKAVKGTNPSAFSKESGGIFASSVEGLDTSDFPVERVSWKDATEFCRKLTEKEATSGNVYRLPTEAEWEYACRGGATKTQKYHTGDTLTKDDANTGWHLKRTAKVGSYKPNGFGLYDMHGNVSEWCGDWYGTGYYGKSPEADPTGPAEGTYRVTRGGPYTDHDASQSTTATRFAVQPGFRGQSFGFRVVRVSGRK
jgi:formylglycine-generating enzyme required for sulfatase activity